MFLFCFFNDIYFFCFVSLILFSFFAVVVFEVFYGTILVLVICFLPFYFLFPLLFCFFSF